jgi:uncharacterized protein YegL
MPIFDSEIAECPPTVLPVFFLLDTSGSMAGERIASLNEAMAYWLEAFSDESFCESGYAVRVAVLQINTACRWLTESLTPVEALDWQDLEAQGISPFGQAFRELERRLNRATISPNGERFAAPVIVFTSDGFACDDWEKPLQQLWNNRYYQVASKIAIGFGEDADTQLLRKMTGSNETVICVENRQELVERMQQFLHHMHPFRPDLPQRDLHEDKVVGSVAAEEIDWDSVWE